MGFIQIKSDSCGVLRYRLFLKKLNSQIQPESGFHGYFIENIIKGAVEPFIFLISCD
jgi:hypothetical protein